MELDGRRNKSRRTGQAALLSFKKAFLPNVVYLYLASGKLPPSPLPYNSFPHPSKRNPKNHYHEINQQKEIHGHLQPAFLFLSGRDQRGP